jgi:hypothetical protein
MSSSYINQIDAAIAAVQPVAGQNLTVTPNPAGGLVLATANNIAINNGALSGITLNLSGSVIGNSSFSLTAAANTGGGTTTYTGTFGNAVFASRVVTISGFTNPGNNTPNGAIVLSNTSTTMVVQNPNGVAESAAASAVVDVTLGVYTVNGVVPPALQVPGAEIKVTITGFTTFPAQNNGTFVVVGANSGFVTVANSSRPSSGQNGLLVAQNSFFTSGVISLRGLGQGFYPIQGTTTPSMLTISANPGMSHQIWTLEGDNTDSAGIDMFQDPNGNHGWELWSSYDGTGANPSFFEMAMEGGNPVINLQLPDENTGLFIDGTHIVPQVGDSTVVELFALSDTVATGFASLLTVRGRTGATGNASLDIDNVNGITAVARAGTITLQNTTVASGGISFLSSGLSGTNITDSGAGINLLATGTGSTISLTNSGNTGTSITDSGAGGLAVSVSGNTFTEVGFINFSNSGGLNTEFDDTGGGGHFFFSSSSGAVAYAVTSVDTSIGNTTVYHGTFPSISLGGNWITIAGFTTSANNGTFLMTASTATTITADNAAAVAETHAATATEASSFVVEQVGKGGTHITDSGGGGISLAASGTGNFLALSGNHLNNNPANLDIQGHISSVSGTTVSYTYAVAFTSTPTVVATPTTNAGAFYLSASSNTGFTITYATSGAQTFNYMVVGNPS